MTTSLIQDLAVQSVMHAAPAPVLETELVESVFRAYQQNLPSLLPVVDEQGVYQGMISPADVERGRQLLDLKEYLKILSMTLSEVARQELSSTCQLDQPLSLTVKELMSVDYPVGQAEDPLHTVIQKLSEHPDAQACVILDPQQRIVGLLTSRDILQLLQVTPVETQN